MMIPSETTEHHRGNHGVGIPAMDRGMAAVGVPKTYCGLTYTAGFVVG